MSLAATVQPSTGMEEQLTVEAVPLLVLDDKNNIEKKDSPVQDKAWSSNLIRQAHVYFFHKRLLPGG